MATAEPENGAATITVGDVDGESYALPIEELLTGRGFVTGKSGAGKSNTGSVIVEELLEEGHPVLIVDLRERVDELEDHVDAVEAERDDLREEVQRLRDVEERVEQAERIEEQLDRAREILGVDVEARAVDADEDVQDLRAQLADAQERVTQLEAENERLREEGASAAAADDDLTSLLNHEAIQAAIDTAKERGDAGSDHFDPVLTVLATADGEPKSAPELSTPLSVSDQTVRRVCKALHNAGVVQTEGSQPTCYKLDREFIEQRIEVAEKQAEIAADRSP